MYTFFGRYMFSFPLDSEAWNRWVVSICLIFNNISNYIRNEMKFDHIEYIRDENVASEKNADVIYIVSSSILQTKSFISAT